MTLKTDELKFMESVALVHEFVNGLEDADVQTEGGPIPTLAKVGARGLRFVGNSSSAVSIDAGQKAFAIEPNKGFKAGMHVVALAGNDYVAGRVVSYVGTTLTVDVTEFSGAGSPTSWVINLTGPQGLPGAVGETGPVGPKGDKGDRGDVGPTGAPGNTGVKGDPGTGARLLGGLDQVEQLPLPGDSQDGDCWIIGADFWALISGAWAKIGTLRGPNGKSAFELAQDAGFGGDEAAWMESLRGQDGIGLRILGSFPSTGNLPVENNAPGDSYIIDSVMWVWDSVQWKPVGQVGPEGKSAYQLAKDSGAIPGTMTLSQWITSLTGKSAFQIAQQNGFAGTQAQWLQTLVGKNNYQLAVEGGFVGTETAWLASLVGAQGAVGPQGPKGDQGDMGPGITILGKLNNTGELPGTGTLGNGYLIAGNFWGWTGSAYEDLGVIQGPAGPQGPAGAAGAVGPKGDKGDLGKSAYQSGLDNGFVGTESQWLDSLKGADGISAYAVAVDNGFVGDEPAWLVSLKGAQGDVGLTGPKGDPGQGLAIKGVVADVPSLPPAPANNDAYVVGTDLYIYITNQWVNAGPFRGAQGPQGATGSTGPVGPKGDKGDKGDQGFTGATGPQGPQGPQGIQGLMGPGIKILGKLNASGELPAGPGTLGEGYLITGEFWGWTGAAYENLGTVQGPKGDKGDKGDPGDIGPVGPQGPQGGLGPVGPAGPKGDKGDKGDTGANVKILGMVPNPGALPGVANAGDAYRIVDNLWSYNGTDWIDVGPWKGDRGDQGIQGIQGDKGDTGPQGPQGPQGIQGLQGDVGETGPMGPGVKILGKINNIVELPPSSTEAGDTYILTTDQHGWTWSGTEWFDAGPIQGPKGDRGLQGVQGLKGDQGDKGNKGDKGDPGTRWIALGRDPSPVDGVVQDYYINTSNLKFFQKTSTTLWSWLGYLGGGNVYDADIDDTEYVRKNGLWKPLDVTEAPVDNGVYVRKNGAWVLIDLAPADGKTYARKDGAWVEIKIAPNDGKTYVQKNGLWVELAMAPTDNAYYVNYNGGIKALDRYDLKVASTIDTLDLADRQIFTVSAASPRTLAFSNAPGAGRAMVVVVKVAGNTGAITWPAGISWSGGTQPTLGATYTNVILLWDGTGWTGSVGATA